MDDNKPKRPLTYKGMDSKESKPVPEPEKDPLEHLPDPGDLGFDDVIVSNETTKKDKFNSFVASSKENITRGANKAKKFTVDKTTSVDKKFWIAGGSVVGVLIFVFILASVFTGGTDPSDTLGVSDSQNENIITAEEATFVSLDSEQVTEDSQKAFDPAKEIVAWQENFLGLELIITQQALPTELAEETFDLKKLAQSIENSQTINQLRTENGTAYIIEQPDGQTGIFNTDEVLVFISSPQVIINEEWINFINQMN